MTDAQEDLSGHYQTQRSQVINHPAYANPVLMTQYGWAKGLKEVWWYETKFEEIKNDTR